MSNILDAIVNIVENKSFITSTQPIGNNRINDQGTPLESYIKDAFAETLKSTESERLLKYSHCFSYSGNKNNPPDIILKNGDAIEIKKIESSSTSLALNSSYPKAKLYSSDAMLTNACKTCEDWSEKDVLYIIGNGKTGQALTQLWMVYGDCYAAEKNIYEKIKTTISTGIHTIPNVEFIKTNELGKVNKVDPLGITDLRIRGMWHIAHPNKVFSYLTTAQKVTFKLNCLILEDKFNGFDEASKHKLTMLLETIPTFSIKSVKIKNPNNPAQLLNAIFMEYYHHE